MNPIKINLIQLKEKKIKTTYVFIGDVSPEIKKDLLLLEKNPKSNYDRLRENYGDSWKSILGVTEIIGGDFDIMPEDLLFIPEVKTSVKLSIGKLKFIFDTIYPYDKISEIKRKINFYTWIPIYKQHLWFTSKSRVYPMNYIIKNNNNTEIINIEELYDFYDKNVNTPHLENIQNMPISVKYYANKSVIKVYDMDEMKLMNQITRIYGVTSFNLVDLDELIEPIGNDTYMIELVYYGFIQLYFPMITFSVFSDMIKKKNLTTLYPDMHPDKLSLQKQSNANQYIHSFTPTSINKSSIIKTTVFIDTYAQKTHLIDLRNLFDKLTIGEITSIRCRMIHENSVILLHKSSSKIKKEKLELNTLTFDIKNLTVNIMHNGNYAITTEWNESQNMSFKPLIQIVQKIINPIIEKINNMKGIFIRQKKLHPVNFYNVRLSNTSMMFYYEKNITEDQFSTIHEIIDIFITAGILHLKEHNALNGEYYFHKGMYKYNLKRLYKTISLSNYYEHWSNGIAKIKWYAAVNKTRLLKIKFTSSQIQVEIEGLNDNEEMEAFHLYLTLLFSLFSSKINNADTKLTIMSKAKKSLKSLKQQDPELYNLRKYNKKIVYSKICQKPHQPLLLSKIEYDSLPKDKLKSAITYWNFTKNTPAYYYCPSDKFPHIKFIIGKHPKNICIPCCKKRPISEGVNDIRKKIYKMCLDTYHYEGEKKSLTPNSTYIAAYGKNIEPGRLSRLPEHSLEPLFFDTYSSGDLLAPKCASSDGYNLFGVRQHMARKSISQINNVGFIFSLAHSLKISINELINQIINLINKEPSKFYIISACRKYFPTIKSFINTLKKIIADEEIDVDCDKYNEIFIDIAFLYMGINVVKFHDNDRNISLILPDNIKNSEDIFTAPRFLVVLSRGKKYYPIYLINNVIYKSAGLIETRLFRRGSSIITTILSVVNKYLTTTQLIFDKIDLVIMKKFLFGKYTILKYFVNHSNLCYALYVENNTDKIYVPINQSYYDSRINLEFNPYTSKQYPVTWTSLKKFIDKYNNWVVNESYNKNMIKHDVNPKSSLKNRVTNIYPYITISRWLMFKSVIGFRCDRLNYYFTPITKRYALSISNSTIHTLLFDPVVINTIIKKKCPPKNDTRNKRINQTTYERFKYQLLLLEFIKYFDNEKNEILRTKLKKLIMRTNFNKPLDHMHKSSNKLITDTEDILKFNGIIEQFINSHWSKQQLLSTLDNLTFNFDKVSLSKLLTTKNKHVPRELKKIATKIITIGKIQPGEFKNIFSTCDSNEPYCSKNKLILDRNSFSSMIDILSSDILNPAKRKWIFNHALVSRNMSFYKFIRRAGEVIQIFVKTKF